MFSLHKLLHKHYTEKKVEPKWPNHWSHFMARNSDPPVQPILILISDGVMACPHPYMIWVVACKTRPEVLYKQAKIALDSLFQCLVWN